MTKKPALKAPEIIVRIQEYQEKRRLKVSFVDPTMPILIVRNGKPIWQKWLTTNKNQTVVKKRSGLTYLRKGIFLVPIWQKVQDWETNFLSSQGIDLASVGIFLFEDGYSRLAYMKDEDLDHAIRQAKHTLKMYFKHERQFPKDFVARYAKILKIGRITLTIDDRLRKMAAFSRRFKTSLKKHHDLLLAILADNCLEKNSRRQKVISELRETIEFCQAIKWRPVYRRLYFAGRSLELAVKYLKDGNIKRAEDRMHSALKNLEYPS